MNNQITCNKETVCMSWTHSEKGRSYAGPIILLCMKISQYLKKIYIKYFLTFTCHWKINICWTNGLGPNRQHAIICNNIPLRNLHPWFIHWGRVTHICVANLTTIGLDNGLSPDRWQSICWTNTGKLLIGPLGPRFIKILIEFRTFQ